MHSATASVHLFKRLQNVTSENHWSCSKSWSRLIRPIHEIFSTTSINAVKLSNNLLRLLSRSQWPESPCHGH